jgi:hypothetical protein
MSTLNIKVSDLPALVAYVGTHQGWSKHYVTTVNSAVKACTKHLDSDMVVDPDSPMMRDAPVRMAFNMPHLAASTVDAYERNWLQLMSVLQGAERVHRSRKGHAKPKPKADPAPVAVEPVVEPVIDEPTPVASEPPSTGLRMSIVVTDDKVVITTANRHIEVSDLDPDTVKAAIQALTRAVLALDVEG